MTIAINKLLNTHYNKKKIRRLMKKMGLKSVIRKKKKRYLVSTPQITAENRLNRNFTADLPNQKWLIDVTKLPYDSQFKAYLSAILDLGDNSVISFVVGNRDNYGLVFKSFDSAVQKNPTASPLVHSDRGFQYTHKQFKTKLEVAGCTQSMSHVDRCIDNVPMENFCGILKA